MTKDELRSIMKEKRRALTHEEVRARSKKIYDNVFSLEEIDGAETVCAYASCFKEPDTGDIIARLMEEKKRAALPVTHVDTGLLSLSYTDGRLVKGAYGIGEPSVADEAYADDIDVFLVPGLAFGRSGERMGFGKGYYDRLLENSRAVKIGVCYDFQLLDAIETREHDVNMDIIVTDKEIIRIGVI